MVGDKSNAGMDIKTTSSADKIIKLPELRWFDPKKPDNTLEYSKNFPDSLPNVDLTKKSAFHDFDSPAASWGQLGTITDKIDSAWANKWTERKDKVGSFASCVSYCGKNTWDEKIR